MLGLVETLCFLYVRISIFHLVVSLCSGTIERRFSLFSSVATKHLKLKTKNLKVHTVEMILRLFFFFHQMYKFNVSVVSRNVPCQHSILASKII